MNLWIFISVLVLIFTGLPAAIYIFFQFKFNYWKTRGVKQIQTYFPLGSRDITSVKVSPGQHLQNIYNKTKHERVIGSYVLCVPTIIINHVEVIKHVLVKDFVSFHDRGTYVDEENDPLAASLFTLSGEKWRKLRGKLTPTFSSGKLKLMFPSLVDIGEELHQHINNLIDKRNVDIKEILSLYTTDVISSCAFGITTNSLANPNSEFRRAGRESMENNFLQRLKIGMCFAAPSIAKFFKFRITKKRVEEFFIRIVRDTVEYRERNLVHRNDFLQLLILLMKNQDKGEECLTLNEAAAQAFVFFTAGFETSSTTLQYSLYELAINHEIQDKTRKEIDEIMTKYNDEITYDGMMEMVYLDQVVAETLRKYPPLPMLGRVATKHNRLPGTNVTVEEGTIVQIPVLGLHHDPDFYPRPEKFDPSRFADEEKQKRHPFSYLPFGEGQRNCIGSRFGLMQTKVGLINLLRHYEFRLSDNTPVPLIFDPNKFVLAPKERIYLNINRCKNKCD